MVKLSNNKKLSCVVSVKPNKYQAKKITIEDVVYNTSKMKAYAASFDAKGNLHLKFKLVNKAESLCFPAELISILAEYYGEEQLPSSPESALVHMVDAVVIRLEAMEQNVGQSVWNRDIVIYQTVNDFSSSEIYDHSGMSMNQFLKIREFLAKEELLR